MWIPLDIILTINITLYQIFENYMQKYEDDLLQNQGDDDDDDDDIHELEQKPNHNIPQIQFSTKVS